MRVLVAAGLLGVAFTAVLAACSGKSKRVGDDDDRSGGARATGGSGASSTGGSGTSGARGGGAGTAGGGPEDWAAACERVPEVVCGKFDECAPLTATLDLPPDCRAFYRQICDDIARLPDTLITPALLSACYDAIAALSCEDWVYNGVIPEVCNVLGTRAPGSPCGNDVQCATGNCTATFTACGTCEAVADEGEDCTLVSCRQGVGCSAAGVCAPPKRLGDPCDLDGSCSSTLICNGGRCAKHPGPGAPCMMGGPDCDIFQGVVCNPQTDLCETPSVPREGEECYELCAAGTYCNTSASPRICVAAQREGEPCSVVLECDALQACRNGVCSRLDPATCN